MSSDIHWVTVNRISSSGNPLSKEQVDGTHLIVYGGEPGKRYRVKVHRHYDALIGGIINPSHEEHRRAVEQRQKREKRMKKKKGRKSRPKRAKGKPSAKQMKRQFGEKRGGPGGRVGSWTTFRTSRHRKQSEPPKQERKQKKTTASQSLQELGKRLGATSVANQEKNNGPSHVEADDSSETVKELRKRAGRHQ